ncbi:MAG: DEAD/DEAH box helicase, partial [Magnetococcales bacterium]|nr:DEAD/DEAH box helicase [Magnetococcales bacterium]
MKFSELAIPEPVMAGIRACGFTDCTDIQEMTLPRTLQGGDVGGQAQTGTGKTAAFLIAVYSRLLMRARAPESIRPDQSTPRALIIAPTRELVVQIERDAASLGAEVPLNVAAVYGGVDYEKQRKRLHSGQVDVLVGTPGRLIDYLKQKVYTCSQVEALVIDEADRMFDMGFVADLRFLLRRLPPPAERLSMLFSATLSYRSQELSYEFMDDPDWIATHDEVKTADQVRQQLFHVSQHEKLGLLTGWLRKVLAEAGDETRRILIFTNTKRMGERLNRWLPFNGVDAGYLSGDVPQNKRMRVLQRFQKGEMPVLVATDVAGRGLHIDDVTHVVNYDLPEQPEDYVHRIGRTARAGAKGDAIALVDEAGAYNLEAIETYLGNAIPVVWPDEDLNISLERPPRAESKPQSRDGGRGSSRDG